MTVLHVYIDKSHVNIIMLHVEERRFLKQVYLTLEESDD